MAASDVNALLLLVEPAAFATGLAVLRLPRSAARDRRALVIAVIAAISAGAAVGADATATGWVPLDMLLLAGVGAAAAFAGARAPSLVILTAAVVSAVGGIGSGALPLALAAMGLVLTSLLVKVDPVVNAAAGALAAQAALRLVRPQGRGLTALVAALVLIPLFVSAARTLERRHQKMLVRTGLALGAFALLGTITGAVAAASALGPLRRGLSVATQAINTTQTSDLDATVSGLADAAGNFATARRALEAWWVRPARAVPVVAQHWRVLRAAALTGHELAEAGQRALTAPALNDVRIRDGRVPLDQLAAIEPPVADVAARASAARRRLDSARSDWLIPPVHDKLESQLRRVRGIDNTAQLANRVLPLVPRLLGRDGPRRYFLAVQTPVEARAGGGFLGNFGEITAEDGRVQLTRFGRHTELTTAEGRERRTLQAPGDYMARYARFRPEQQWVNVNLSPDFPTDAQVIGDLYPQSGGAPIDGVIAVDPAALAALLTLVGPVQVPSWPEPITGANALQVLLYDQYRVYDEVIENQRERLDFLGDVAQEAWRRLTSGDLPPVPQLMATLGPAVQTKHIFLSSTRPDEQRLFEDMRAAGKMAPVNGDFVGLVTQNAAGNKIDYFLRRHLDYRVQLDPGSGRVQASVTVTLDNEAPAEGAPSSVIGSELMPPPPPGTNKLYLSFYTPWELVAGDVDGTRIEFERGTELGRKVYSTAISIPTKSTSVVQLSLVGRLPKDSKYRLDVYRQPVVAPDDLTATLVVGPGWTTTSGGREHTVRQQVESDLMVEVPLRRR